MPKKSKFIMKKVRHHYVKNGGIIYGNGCPESHDCFEHCPYKDGCHWNGGKMFDSGHIPEWNRRWMVMSNGQRKAG
jgi:hypothetical protein